MNPANLMLPMLMIICTMLILSHGNKTVKIKKHGGGNKDVQPKSSTLKTDGNLGKLSKQKAHASRNKWRKAHLKVGKKMRNGKMKKIKAKKLSRREKAKLKSQEKHTSKDSFTKRKLKKLEFKRSNIQSETLENLAKGSTEFDKTNKCGECISQECPSVDTMYAYCASGVVKDECGCCVQCASSVGMPCYLSPSTNWLAPCGIDLACVPATMHDADVKHAQAVWGSKVALEGICFCTVRDAVCTNDDATYENICEFREAAVRQSMMYNLNITISHRGPCRTAPKITSKPEDRSDVKGNVVSYRCETSGFPIPRVQWIKRGGNIDNGRDLELPGYLNHAVTQIRGGPGKYQMTTWLTLDRVTESDNGVYVCRASNYYGVAEAAAGLRIIEK